MFENLRPRPIDPLLDIRTPIIVASLQNNAGIVGAAAAAAEGIEH